MGDLDQAEGRKTAPDSLDMHRPFGRLWRHRPPPVHSLQKQRKLRRCQHHTPIDQRRPHEAMALEPLGEKLDPNKHQAVFELPHPEYPDGHVAQVMQAGYVLKGRLLRPAMVGVTKNPAGEKPSQDDTPGGNVDTSA